MAIEIQGGWHGKLAMDGRVIWWFDMSKERLLIAHANAFACKSGGTTCLIHLEKGDNGEKTHAYKTTYLQTHLIFNS